MSNIQYQRNWLGSSICFLAAKVADHWSSVRLKVTREEQEKMQQSIEKQQETKLTQSFFTVTFRDRKAFLAVNYSFRARGNAASSMSDPLTGDLFALVAVPSLSSPLKVSASRAHSRHRMRRRTSPHIETFSAEEPMARSALVVLAAIPNTRSTQAVATVITSMTEQRRCAAA